MYKQPISHNSPNFPTYNDGKLKTDTSDVQKSSANLYILHPRSQFLVMFTEVLSNSSPAFQKVFQSCSFTFFSPALVPDNYQRIFFPQSSIKQASNSNSVESFGLSFKKKANFNRVQAVLRNTGGHTKCCLSSSQNCTNSVLALHTGFPCMFACVSITVFQFSSHNMKR